MDSLEGKHACHVCSGSLHAYGILCCSIIQFIIKIPQALPARWTCHLIEIGCQERFAKTWKIKQEFFFLEKDTLPQLVRNQDTGTCHYSKQLKSSLRSGNLAWQRVPSSWPDCPCLLFIFFQSIWLGVWWKPSQTSFLLCRLINSRAHSHPKSEKQHKKVGLSICLIRLPTFWETSYRHVSGKDILISWNRRNKSRKERMKTSPPYPSASAPLISLFLLICEKWMQCQTWEQDDHTEWVQN